MKKAREVFQAGPQPGQEMGGHCYVKVRDRKLESVEVVKRLGVMISGDGRMEEIRSRFGKAARVIGVLNDWCGSIKN